MYDLKLGTPSDQLTLLGDLVAAPWRGGVLKSSAFSLGAAQTGQVTEVYHLALEDTPANLALALSHLQSLLNQAANYTRHRLGRPVYLWGTQVSGDPQFASRLLAGSFAPVPGSSSREQGSLGLALTLTRLDFWEGQSVYLPLSNRSATRVTTGVGVTNHLDADANHDNFVDILGSDIAGDLPAATAIDFTNASLTAYSLDSLILHLNANSAPTTFTPVLEGAGTADASCSSGNKLVASVTTTDTALVDWTLQPAQVAAAGGNDFMLLLRLATPIPAADTLLHPALFNISSKILDLPAVLVPANQGLLELGVLTIPPGIDPLAQSGPATIHLKLWAKTTTGSRNLEIDFVYLAAMDGYRRFNRVGRTLYQDECIVDDGYSQTCYLMTNATALTAPNYTTFGAQFLLIPGLTQRLGFFQVGPHPAEIDRPGWVHVQYKPRKRLL